MSAYAHTLLAATANVAARPAILAAVILTGGSDAATAIVYDATSGTDNKVLQVNAAVATTVAVYPNVALSRGIQVAITGTAPVCTVIYR